MSLLVPTVQMCCLWKESGHCPVAIPSVFDVQTYMRGNEKIQLIKFMRSYTGLGLREAKDAIESVEDQPIGTSSGPRYGARCRLLLEPIFKAYGLTCLTDEDKAVGQHFAQDVAVASNLILKGIATVLETWKDMGYKNPYEACHQVLTNLERNGRV